MIKAIFFDVDGTIISHKTKTIADSTKKAIQQLKDKGIHVCMVTGRHMTELEEFAMLDIEFDGYIMQNGQICYDSKKKMVSDSPLDEAHTNRFLTLFREKRIPIQFIDEDGLYLNFVDDRVRRVQRDISSPVPPVSEYKGKPVYQVCAFLDDEDAEKMFRDFAACKSNRWHREAIEFVDGDGGKMAGIDKYIATLGLTREEIMAIGDGENDIDMIQCAGIGVAMGNAKDHVKVVADYVSTDVDNDGVMNALKHFGIL